MQSELADETRNLNEALEQNIKLKAAMDEMNTKCVGLESKVTMHITLALLKFLLIAHRFIIFCYVFTSVSSLGYFSICV